MKYKYDHVACGGTFDLLHKGHTTLLDRAFKIGKQVSIGITTDLFCKEIGKIPYESAQIRKRNLLSYLKFERFEKRAKIVWLNNIHGTTNKDKTLEAIVVSKETVEGARKINEKRSKLKLKKLQLVICPQVLAQDGKKISTGRIRSGEISSAGQNYKQLLLKIASRRFNNHTRTNLKQPFGKIIRITKNTKFEKPIIAVGDISVKNFIKNHISPNISIVDFFVNRKRIFKNLSELGFAQPNPDYVVKNAPGQVSKDLIETVYKVIKNFSHNQIIFVNGEEDLAFIPALLLSPIPATVVYGQPDKGLVRVDVTPQAKDRLCSLLRI